MNIYIYLQRLQDKVDRLKGMMAYQKEEHLALAGKFRERSYRGDMAIALYWCSVSCFM
tara:strand:+ start:187 stop:360 length:174 start_codon:yes stop_codon:yes gene_type:complete